MYGAPPLMQARQGGREWFWATLYLLKRLRAAKKYWNCKTGLSNKTMIDTHKHILNLKCCNS